MDITHGMTTRVLPRHAQPALADRLRVMPAVVVTGGGVALSGGGFEPQAMSKERAAGDKTTIERCFMAVLLVPHLSICEQNPTPQRPADS